MKLFLVAILSTRGIEVVVPQQRPSAMHARHTVTTHLMHAYYFQHKKQTVRAPRPVARPTPSSTRAWTYSKSALGKLHSSLHTSSLQRLTFLV